MTDTLLPRTIELATDTRPPSSESRAGAWLRSNWMLLALMAVGAAAAVAMRAGVFPCADDHGARAHHQHHRLAGASTLFGRLLFESPPNPAFKVTVTS